MMKKIAIQVTSSERNHAYDRRRLLPFAEDIKAIYGIDYEWFLDIKELDFVKYDIIVISIRSDLPFVLKKITRQKKVKMPKIIFDYCDFIHMGNSVVFFIKSFFAYNRKSYSTAFTKKSFFTLLSSVDTIIVGSEAQKREISKFNNRIFVISDILDEIPLLSMEADRGNQNGILWEGFASANFFNFKYLFRILSSKKIACNLHLVTDQRYYFVAGKYLGINTLLLFQYLNYWYRINSFNTTGWSISNLLENTKRSTIGLIPISKNKIAMMKPENKIVLLIRLGLYPVVSKIPSYEDFAKKYNLNICFSNISQAQLLLNNITTERENLRIVREQILSDYSRPVIMKKWVSVFDFKTQ